MLVVIVVFSALSMMASFSSCAFPAATERNGSLELSAVISEGSRLDIAGAKTIAPLVADITISSYRIYGTGPGGVVVKSILSKISMLTIDNLEPGEWAITVEGLDASTPANIIASGSTTVLIVSGETTAASITLVPQRGTGTFNLTVAWPQCVGAVNEVRGELSSPVFGNFSFSKTAASALYDPGTGNVSIQETLSGLASASYFLTVTFHNNLSEQLGPALIETIIIYHDKSSSGSMTVAENFFPVAMPIFTPGSGTYPAGQSVTITTTTRDGIIHYTIDGSAPSISSPLYTQPLTISGTTTLKAIAVRNDMTSSIFGSASYGARVATPTLSPGAGTYTTAQNITITTTTPGATIHYTTDGSTPTSSSTMYTGPVGISATKTLKAIAVKPGLSDSDTEAATYTILLAVRVTGVTLDKTAVTLYSTYTSQLAATVVPTNAANKSVLWTSSAPSVASVDATGLVTALSAGSATISVTTGDGGFNATCAVTVWRYRAISAGWGHSLFLGTDDILRGAGFNSSGQLGDGTTVNKATPVQMMTSVGLISAGYYHSIIIKTNGTLWAVGNNASGQLGDGTLVDKSTAIQILHSGGTNINQSAAGGGFHTMVMETNGSLWTNGRGNEGQLGNGSLGTKSIPGLILSSNIQSISSGRYHSMYIMTDGNLWGTGQNTSGQLGDNTTASRRRFVQISGMSGIQSVSAGDSYTLAIKTDGTLWATGLNSSGQLGTGDTSNQITFIQVMSSVAAVSTGIGHTMILRTDGTLWATGLNTSGQLGDATKINKSTPVQIMSSVAAVAAGGTHTLILKTDGSLWATGDNTYGQFGNGTSGVGSSSTIPVRIM